MHAVHCLVSMLQISSINIKAIIGFSDVQELGSFFKNFLLWEKATCVKQKKGAVIHPQFWDRTNISWAITTILFRKQPSFTCESMEM